MNVSLFSQNEDLYNLCRVALSELPVEERRLVRASHEDSPAEADLYIWDFDADEELPAIAGRSSPNQLFLVRRKDLSDFQARFGGIRPNILLKPVTRSTLSAFLGLAASLRGDGASAADSLRADRDEIFQCLLQTNLKLQEYDQERTNFLARAIHDFRAPLTAISGYCGLLLSGALGPVPEDQRDLLQRMEHSAKRLSRMASAMFQLSTRPQVARRLDRRLGNVQECVDQALHEVAPLANERKILVSIDHDPEAHPVYIEPDLIEQVLVNLLDNACKFTPRSGEIEVRGYPYFWERRSIISTEPMASERRKRDDHEPNAFRVDILDSGPPIPPEHLEDIFEEYTSYFGGRDRSAGGLGLAICRMILSQHEGRIWAENTDRGPVFSFVLPLRREDGDGGSPRDVSMMNAEGQDDAN